MPTRKEHQTKMTTTRYNKWCSRMKEHNQTITQYFNIDPPKGSHERLHMEIVPSQSMEYCIMTMYYTNTPQYSLHDFPNEINNLIYEYYKEEFTFHFKIDFGEYPFRPPKWSLDYFEYRFSTEYDKSYTKNIVEAYCVGILRCHNCQNEEDWSPAIMIHSDILSFYILINNFRTLIEKLKTKNSFDPFPRENVHNIII